MEFTIQKEEFLKGLRPAQSIADRKSTIPMLANVLLRTTGNDELLVAATDVNVSVSAQLGSQNTGEGGITIAAKSLHDIINKLPGDTITLRRTDNNWAEITAGKVAYRVVGMPDRDFPKIPDHREIEFSTVNAGVLREMIDQTMFSISNDETRFHLSGALFESDGKTTRMVSTDGHRLSKVERELDGAPVLTAGVIIPKKGISEIKRILEGATECQIAVKTPYVYVSSNSMTLAVKLIEAQFPPYSQVIPKSHTKEVVVDRGMLIDALRRAQLMSSETRGVKFALAKGALVVSSDNPDIGEVREELEAQYDGEEMAIGFNAKYVVELLSQIPTDQIVVELNGILDPGVIRPFSDTSYLGVVMPMRI